MTTLRPRYLAAALAVALGPALGAAAAAAEHRVDPARSTLLVRLYKDGPASAFAHDHVVRATRFTGSVRYDPARPAESAVQVEVETAGLVADEPELRRRLDLAEMSDGTRRDVQRTMLGARQLGAEQHPRIAFRSTAVSVQGEGRLRVEGELSLHGETKPVSFPAEVELTGDGLRARATLRFRQSDFGIAPYRFAFGAVRNRDEVEMIVDLVAK
jgi:polyisoprenoid-binding protein YceI